MSYLEIMLYLSVLVVVFGNAVIWYLTRRDLSAIVNWILTLPGVFERMQKNTSAAWVVPGNIGRLISKYGAKSSDGTIRSTFKRRGSAGASSQSDANADLIMMYRPRPKKANRTAR